MPKLRMFCFACRDRKNIRLGVHARTWAVATVGDQAMKSRRAKALKYMKVGDFGLLYCNPIHAFQVPFVVTSSADADRVVTDVWPESWALPFGIQPLSDGSRTVSKELAREKWNLLRRLPWKGSISATLNFTGTTVFVPTLILEDEWHEILKDLRAPS